MATLSECADYLETTEDELKTMIADGVISAVRKFDLDTVRLAYIRHWRELAAGRGSEGQALKADEDARVARARADIAELEVGLLIGKFVEAADVGDALSDAVMIMRTNLLAMPVKLAARAGVRDNGKVERGIRDVVYRALDELAHTRVV